MSQVYSLDPHTVLDSEAWPIQEYRDWSVRNTGLDRLPFKGEGQLIGILDTEVDIRHPDLDGQVEYIDFILNGVDVGLPMMPAHGTFVAGQLVGREDGQGLVGAAPKANAVCGRVLYGNSADLSRPDTSEDIAYGIDECVSAGCGVISMSFGSIDRSSLLERTINKAVDDGVILVASAGNDKLFGSPSRLYPAAYPGVISVASADEYGLPAWFSSVGDGNDDQPSAQPEIAISSKPFYWGCMPGGRYGRMIGTSMATPIVAAVAALWLEARTEAGTLPSGPDVLKRFRSWLHRVVNDTNNNGWDPELGYGTLLLDADELEDFGL